VPSSTHKPEASLSLDLSLLVPGMSVVVGLSGGADSVALLRALTAGATELGLVVSAAHLHHGLRGAEADGDLEFCRDLAAKLGVPFHEGRVDTGAAAEPDPKTGKSRETIEEAARRLRYSWFRQLLSEGRLHAVVATAHTLDDQAETVLAKFLRGAWTEGLSGIYPKLEGSKGERIIRPLLNVKRTEVEAYLRAVGQDWREDSTNKHLSFTRNRIRHELLPVLEGWNPRLREHLAQMAELARDEEAWWDAEVSRLAPQLILPGQPVRGGGRASGAGLAAGIALDFIRLAALAPALQRRLLRHAAGQFGVALDFTATQSLRSLALSGRAGQKLELPNGIHAERTPREVQLSLGPNSAQESKSADRFVPEYNCSIPGQFDAPGFGLRLRIEFATQAPPKSGQKIRSGAAPQSATLRNWRPGDRVTLRYSSGPRKVKEVLERLRVTGSDRSFWPVLEFDGRIAWMKGVELEPDPKILVTTEYTGEPAEPAAEAPARARKKSAI
jgi:tRNA(Ile)-lysidine synthase